MSYTQQQTKESLIQERYSEQTQLRRTRRMNMLATKRLQSLNSFETENISNNQNSENNSNNSYDETNQNNQNNQINETNQLSQIEITLKNQLQYLFQNPHILNNIHNMLQLLDNIMSMKKCNSTLLSDDIIRLIMMIINQPSFRIEHSLFLAYLQEINEETYMTLSLPKLNKINSSQNSQMNGNENCNNSNNSLNNNINNNVKHYLPYSNRCKITCRQLIHFPPKDIKHIN